MKQIIKLLVISIALSQLSACTEDSENRESFDIEGRHIEFLASMPTDDTQMTRVGLEQASGSLTLIPKWKDGDQVHLFILHQNKIIDIGSVSVRNIQPDGKSCGFDINLPASMENITNYVIYGICSDTGVEAQVSGNKIVFNCKLMRKPNSQFKAPVYFIAQGGLKVVQANFKHLGTYEIIHLKNKSSKISYFRVKEMRAKEKWFHEEAIFDVSSASVTAKTPTNPIGTGTGTLLPGVEGTFVSWYLPTGKKMTTTTLVAVIDGNEVTSTNTKSSNVSFERGRSYHMYVEWDGSKLRFVNASKGDNGNCELKDMQGQKL